MIEAKDVQDYTDAVQLLKSLRTADLPAPPEPAEISALLGYTYSYQMFSGARWASNAMHADREKRHYHNIRHAIDVFDKTKSIGVPSEVACMFGVYHDCRHMYGLPGEAESASIDAFFNDLSTAPQHQVYLTQSVCSVTQGIAASALHHTEQSYLSTVVQSMLDADLWGLGTDDYWKNGELIRREAIAFGATHAQFLTGREKWLKLMLEKDQLFYTPIARRLGLESVARRNMGLELHALIDGELT